MVLIAILEKHDKASFSTALNKDTTDAKTEEETIGHIFKHEQSTAALLCMMKNHAAALSSEHSLTKDVVGIVATLGKVEDDNLSRHLAQYLGKEKMLAVVCKTYDGVKALETYNKEGLVDKTLGVHAFAATTGRPLAGRFLVICLEDIRFASLTTFFAIHYAIIPGDPQKSLDLQKPRLPDGETPPGFLGFALNMIIIDGINLHCISKNGHGLRETVFYNLLSNLQVYRSREDMVKALSCIRNGAISVDGGIIRNLGPSPWVIIKKGNGPFYFSCKLISDLNICGSRGDIGVKFPNGSESLNIPEKYFEIKSEMKETEWKKDRALGDMRREQNLLDHARLDYETKKREFLQFLAESSSHLSQVSNGAWIDPKMILVDAKIAEESKENSHNHYAIDGLLQCFFESVTLIVIQ
ncbi:hypothetical protein OROGR_025845 [Orobanche gracilis]